MTCSLGPNHSLQEIYNQQVNSLIQVLPDSSPVEDTVMHFLNVEGTNLYFCSLSTQLESQKLQLTIGFDMTGQPLIKGSHDIIQDVDYTIGMNGRPSRVVV